MGGICGCARDVHGARYIHTGNGGEQMEMIRQKTNGSQERNMSLVAQILVFYLFHILIPYGSQDSYAPAARRTRLENKL